jgi:endonuclease/exonuclease/phosphatase (EEP) superfamily protein YafD
MALCPFAKHLLIPPGSSDPAIKPRVAILHVDAGGASSLFHYFRDRSGGIESHFHIKWDGTIEQYRDTGFQADANLDANAFAIAIETQGFGNGTWSKAQIASIKRLLLWLKAEHGIPLIRCTGPYGAGVGYHVMWGAPGPWTPVAKSCPGPNRIRQFEGVLLPWMATATTPPKPKRVRLEVITANLWRENRFVAADLAEIAKMKPHVVGVNEGANHRAHITSLEGYQAVYGTQAQSRSALQNPILLRKDLKVLNSGVIEVSKPINRSPGRTAVWVTYEFLGQKRAHVNTHFNSHVQAGARVPHNLPRVGEYVKGIRKVKRLVESLQDDGYKVTLTGDMNWSFTEQALQWRWAPKRVFKKVGMEAQFVHNTDPDRPKGDPRRIEYVFADPNDLTIASQRFVKREHSDHPYHSVTYIVKGL